MTQSEHRTLIRRLEVQAKSARTRMNNVQALGTRDLSPRMTRLMYRTVMSAQNATGRLTRERMSYRMRYGVDA